jgi:hypothetical protein
MKTPKIRKRHAAWFIAALMLSGCSPSPRTSNAEDANGDAGARLGTTSSMAAISDTFPKRDTIPLPSPSPRDTIPRPR